MIRIRGRKFKKAFYVCYIREVQQRLRSNLAEVKAAIGAAAKRAGREASKIKLVAVSKTHPAAAVRQAIEAGIAVFGENKVQEAESKIITTGRQNAEWHLIGHLQSNKARKAVHLFDVIESVDSVGLAQRLERICLEDGRAELPIFVQVDLAGEATKTGAAEGDLPAIAEYLLGCKSLKFKGLMSVPPYFEDPEDVRPFFRRLREIRDDMNSKGLFAAGTGELSMGMSHDFEIAIVEGSTIVRVGTAIFGEREYGNP
jgi:pyridoxal phosphate enzyme (YggS family)